MGLVIRPPVTDQAIGFHFCARKKLQRRAAVAGPPDSAEQSIQLESCSATPLTFRPWVRRRTERRTTLETRHHALSPRRERADSEEATDEKAGGQQSEDPKGVPRRNPRRCCAEGPYGSPEKKILVLDIKLLTREF